MSEQETTKAELYVQSKGWQYRMNGQEINLRVCPMPECGNTDWKFYCNSEKFTWLCHKCQTKGNESTLKNIVGDRVHGVSSQRDSVQNNQKPEPLPDLEVCHKRLLDDFDALDYLRDVRGFTLEIIEKMKLGLEERSYFKEGTNLGTFKSVVYPYFVGGNYAFAKWRTLPPAPKHFRTPQGRGNPLYNQDVVTKGMDELILVEGEADTVALLSQGIPYVAGVPGADAKKITWDKLLDHPKKIYLLFDNDHAGQEGAYNFALRFGIERFFNIRLPAFEKEDGAAGKDISEWFAAGHTVEELNTLKEQAAPFNVAGVQNLDDALDDLERGIDETGTIAPRYTFAWPSVNAKAGGYDKGQLIGLTAPGKIGKTTWVQNELDYQAEQGHVCMLFCLEMETNDLAKKAVAKNAKIDMSPYPGTDPIELAVYNKAKAEEFKSGINIVREKIRSRKGDLLFAHSNRIEKPEDVFATMEAAHRRYGVDIFAFDNLQLLADSTLRNAAHRTTHLSQLTKHFKRFASEKKVPVFLIMQPKKLANGEMATSNDIDGTGQAEKDVDMMIVLHRNPEGKMKAYDLETMEIVETPAAFSSKMFVRVDRSRYAPGGLTKLFFEQGMSWIREYDNEKDGGPVARAKVTDLEGMQVGEMEQV